MLNFEKCFRLRGIINQVSSNRLFQKLEQKQVIYAGFDPSASSLHVGNLLALITLMRFKSYGHDVIALVGGATAQIGDPSFRSTERNLLSDLENVKNTSSIISQINQVFKTSESYIKKYSLLEQGTLTIKNNLDWYSSMNILDFLKTIGNHHRISIMLSKDAVKSRLDSQTGMSYTEFTYPILQAYDFYYLYTKYNCTVQIGGSDQWGLKDDLEPPVFALTTPLVTTSTGEKFGKSAGNAIWLDKNLVSVYEFYQFFIKTPDSLIEKYLKYFTFLSIEEITDIIQKSITESGYAQKQLAFHVTELVHGYAAAQSAAIKSGILFNESNYNATDIINSLSTDSDFIRLDKSLVINSSLINIAVLSGSCPSKSAARKILNSGGVYIRGERVTDVSHVITKSDLLDDSLLVLRIGKQEFKIIQVV